jgi:hypothetical protein
MQLKSEKLKKMEVELGDLERWLELGLVPRKDQPKHEEEIRIIREKMSEEEGRIRFLKEHGDLDEYVAPKRQPAKTVYQAEMPTLPDVDAGQTRGDDDAEDSREVTRGTEETTVSEDKEEDESSQSEADEESYFSDRARWKRGGIVDPEANDW